jgi:peptidoglycan hydrolase-like protein with peptidoglycan-binding domain
MLRLPMAALLVVMAAPAFAQSPPPLSYQQPLAPPAVRAVQERLHQLGAYTGAVDGNWGSDSQSALQRFQQSHGLMVTGEMNAATVSALGLDAPRLLQFTTNAPSPPNFTHLSRQAVRDIQGRLRSLGFYNGALDGQWGGETQAAVTRLQQNRGFQPTGQLDEQTVRAMGLNPESLTASAQ